MASLFGSLKMAKEAALQHRKETGHKLHFTEMGVYCSTCGWNYIAAQITDGFENPQVEVPRGQPLRVVKE